MFHQLSGSVIGTSRVEEHEQYTRVALVESAAAVDGLPDALVRPEVAELSHSRGLDYQCSLSRLHLCRLLRGALQDVDGAEGDAGCIAISIRVDEDAIVSGREGILLCHLRLMAYCGRCK